MAAFSLLALSLFFERVALIYSGYTEKIGADTFSLFLILEGFASREAAREFMHVLMDRYVDEEPTRH